MRRDRVSYDAHLSDPLDLIGRNARLKVRRFASAGAFLGVDGFEDTILLPHREVPEGTTVDAIVDVFVYLDSDDRPIATTRTPKLALHEVTFLEVTAITPIGAFVDWGLPKELLVPFAEHVRELAVGERHPFGLYLDRSERLAATMYVGDMLDHHAPERRRIKPGEWIHGEAWRNDPDIGLFVILERRFVGLVPASEPHTAGRGDAIRTRVAEILPDGKLVLSLRDLAHKEQANDATRILEMLRRPNAPRVGDHSDAEEIRALFGISKKAFKRALGNLLKQRLIAIDRDGVVTLLAK